MTLREIAAAFGGELWAGGLRASIPAPGHSPADRSVSLLLSEGRVLIHCFGDGDWREVRKLLEAHGFVDADGRLRSDGRAPGHVSRVPRTPGATERIRVAEAVWSEGRPLAGTLSAKHLRLRAIRAPAAGGLRHHPGLPLAVYAGAGPRRPALLAALRTRNGALCGVEVCYLAPDGRRAEIARPRKLIGMAPAGCAVRLSEAAPQMLVGEGVATTLSAAERFSLPAWALLSAGNLARWTPPGGVRSVLIAADRGAAGKGAAEALRARLTAGQVKAIVRLPPAPFGDWNDLAQAEQGRG